ncbi:hypothetical protein [Dyadobacter sandarakinus]|uniref:Dolichyl-phosphate-mannose-protein mannosyltransferase n=1 Tax=Dyadobacter sandarakinus TaxID=2747268 RepID=A0ABX7I5U7_9BACT|nr:hypothetical protein [Dyadobacter sandarakinus]QRR01471.1 hypothetical protein HWI92_11430 [Dyadobacter sandarakinus]
MLPITKYRVNTLLIILLSFVALTIATYINRFPTGDDGWFAEQSYWLYHQGIIRSEFFRGIAGWENGLLVSHKLFLAFGSMLISWFGYDLPILKISGFFFFLILIIELIAYIRQREKQNLCHYIVAILILVFSNRLLIKMSFENRPEMMVAAFGFGSFLLLNFKREQRTFVLLSGFLAGLSFLTHLNGVIYVIAGVLALWGRPIKISRMCFFLLGATLSGSMYLIDILSVDNGMSTWWFQFRNDPATQASFNFTQKLIQIVTYPRMFFQSPEQLSLSVLLVYFLWLRRKMLAMLPAFLSKYTVLLIASFWIVSKANAGMYLVLFIPLMLVSIYELYILSPITPNFKWMLALYFTIGIYGSGQLVYKNWKLGYLPNTYHEISKQLPKSSLGVVPLTFFYNDYNQFTRLLAHENYKLYCHKQNMSSDGFAKWAKANNP